MIFIDLIRELENSVTKAVDELFNAAWEKQTHPQDMLLADQHGFYSETPACPRRPYVIGPDEIGFGERTFYEFIDWYRQSHLRGKADFEKKVAEDEEARKQEELTVQLEQSIYLRFWEADSLLKQYCQLSALASGEPYNWKLKIPVHSREGSKCSVIRKKIRDRVKDICPAFYALVKSNYISQVRNAIAHSQFYIDKRSIYFLNYSDNTAAHAKLKGMSFDEWYRTFHKTLLLHNATIGTFKKYRKRYRELTLTNGNRINIRIISTDGSESFSDLGVRRDRDEWIWHKNLREEDLS